MVLTKLDLPSPRGGFPRARPGPPSPPASWSPGVHDRPAAHGRCGQQTRNHLSQFSNDLYSSQSLDCKIDPFDTLIRLIVIKYM